MRQLLASIGIYGVLSYAVMQRTNEIGVRMALGATSGDILLTAMLYGFRPDYIATVAAVSLILAAVAALACFVPARRASLVDPMIALRQD